MGIKCFYLGDPSYPSMGIKGLYLGESPHVRPTEHTKMCTCWDMKYNHGLHVGTCETSTTQNGNVHMRHPVQYTLKCALVILAVQTLWNVHMWYLQYKLKCAYVRLAVYTLKCILWNTCTVPFVMCTCETCVHVICTKLKYAHKRHSLHTEMCMRHPL